MRRLVNSGLIAPWRRTAASVVASLGAVQAQEYAHAKWGLAIRAAGLTDEAVEQAFAAGEIIRTHVMRPTWHFVAREDLRWLMDLTAERVHAKSAQRYRELGIDDATARKSQRLMEKALARREFLTRAELGQELERAGIDTKVPQRLPHILARAELDQVICSGPRRGKQFTYALFDSRVPSSDRRSRDESLLDLVTRYFKSRGPATPQDFSWWSGLTVRDAKRGLEAAGNAVENTSIDGKTYWSGSDERRVRFTSPLAHLLPVYDEFFIGFRDRSAIGQRARESGMPIRSEALQFNVFTVDGQMVGGWKVERLTNSATIRLDPVVPLPASDRQAVLRAARKYGDFAGVPVNAEFVRR